ncbi:MAG: phosphotransferase family protein [Candidatus Nanohaloarchaea archaeon]
MKQKKLEKLLKDKLPQKVSDIEKSSIGRAHHTFKLRTENEKYLLKISDNDTRFQVEAPVLELLESKDVRTPKIIDFDNSRSKYDFQYLICEFVEGENVDRWENSSGPNFAYMSESRKKSLLESAGEQLSNLHSQTSFEGFGHFRCRNSELEFRQKGSWKETFREIIIQEQVSNLPEKFQDLKPIIEEFVESNIDILENAGDACLIHQDFRWPNILVDGDQISRIVDWERALSGHHEYDLAKAEESILQFTTQKAREKYRDYFLDSYMQRVSLEEGWSERRKFYRALRPVEALWTFEGWSKGMREEKKQELAEKKRQRLLERIENF